MKKFRMIVLPVLLLAVVFGVILAVNAGAETAQYKVYLSPTTAYDAAGGEIDGVTYDLVGGANGYKEVFAQLKTVMADYTVNSDGNPSVGGTEKEVWVYVSGTVTRTLTAESGITIFGTTGDTIKGSDSNWVHIHITSADTSDAADYGTLDFNCSTTGGLYTMNNCLHFKQIKLSTHPTATSTVSLCQMQLGTAPWIYIDEDVTLTPYKGSSKGTYTAQTESVFWAGASTSNYGNKSVGITATILSGKWSSINMYGSYRGYVSGNVNFTFGGGATATVIAGVNNPVAAYKNESSGTNNKYGRFGEDRPNSLSVNLTCTITGGTVTNYYGGFGKTVTDSVSKYYRLSTINGSVVTNVSGGTITYFYGGGYQGDLNGAVTNNVTGGTITYFYGGARGCCDLYAKSGSTSPKVVDGGDTSNQEDWVDGEYLIGAEGSSVVTGKITNNLSGTITGSNSTTRIGTSTSHYSYGGNKFGKVDNSIETTIDGVKFAGNFYGGGQGENPDSTEGLVTGNVTNTIRNAIFAGTFFGAGHTADVNGTVRNTVYKGTFANLRAGGSYPGDGNAYSSNRSLIKGGVLTRIIPENDADVVVTSSTNKSWVSGTGMSKVSGTVTYEKDGVTYSGAVIMEITGGTFTGTNGAGASSFNYCVGASDQAVTGDIVNLISGGIFSDFLAAGRLAALTGSVYNYISGGTFNGPNPVSFGKGNMSSGSISGRIVNVVTGGDFRVPVYLSGMLYNVGASSAGLDPYVKDGVSYDATVLTFISGGSFTDIYATQRITGTGNTITGDVETYITGGAIGNFYSGDQSRTVSGSVRTSISGSGVDRFIGGSKSGGDTLAVDLSAGNASFAFEAQADVTTDTGIAVASGAGTLTLTSLSGAPEVTLTGATVTAHPYITLPAGSDEDDIALTLAGGANAVFAGDSFIGGLVPVGSTIIMENGGNFALRYLYASADVAAWTLAAGGEPTFTYSLDGATFSEEVTLSDITVDVNGVPTAFKTFVVSGIKAKDLDDTVTVRTASSGADDEYSVAEACDTVVSLDQNAAFVAFANALLDYGKAANAYHNNDATPVTYSIDVTASDYTDLYADESYRTGTGTLVNIRGTSIVTKDALFLKFYMQIDPSADPAGLKVWVNGAETAIALEANGKYHTASYRVPANEMDSLAAVEVRTATGELVSNIYADSITSYCASIVSRRNESAEYEAFTPLARYVEEFVFSTVRYLDPVAVPNPRAAAPDYTFDHAPTVSEMRATAVQAMRDQLSVQWFPRRTVSYVKEGAAAGSYTFSADKLYMGMPYTNAGMGIFQFLEYYDPATGELGYTDSATFKNAVGNSCASSAVWGLYSVCDSMSANAVTYYLTPSKGYYALGGLTFHDADFDDYRDYTNGELVGTKLLLDENGTDAVLEAYALLQPADLLISVYGASGEHTRMAIGTPNVVRNGSGKIDAAASTVTVQEQTAQRTEESVGEATLLRTVSSSKTYTFQQLLNKWYIAVSVAEFLDPENHPYQAASVVPTKTIGTLDDMQTARLVASRPMAVMKVVLSQDGSSDVTLGVKFFNRMNFAHDRETGRGAFNYYVGELFKSGSAYLNIADDARLPASGTFTVTLTAIAADGAVFSWPVTVTR